MQLVQGFSLTKFIVYGTGILSVFTENINGLAGIGYNKIIRKGINLVNILFYCIVSKDML